MVENSRGSWKHRKTPLEQFAMRKMLVPEYKSVEAQFIATKPILLR